MGYKHVFIVGIVFASLSLILSVFATFTPIFYHDGLNICYDWWGIRYNCQTWEETYYASTNFCTSFKQLVYAGAAVNLAADAAFAAIIILCAITLGCDVEPRLFRMICWIIYLAGIGLCFSDCGIIVRLFGYSICGGETYGDLSYTRGASFGLINAAGCVSVMGTLFVALLPITDDHKDRVEAV